MNMGKIWARGMVRLASAALCLGLIAVAPQARAVGGDTVRGFYDTLLANMRSGPSLGAHGRYARIEPVIRRAFDIPFMTRLAVGPEWANLTEAQRQQVSQAFERYVAAAYAERFDSYSRQKQPGTREQPPARRTIITTPSIQSTTEPLNINHLLRP